jgi:poly(3-hydroxybutyrate) depolymerase
MLRRALGMALFALLPALAGCPVFQNQNTPVDQFQLNEAAAKTDYWLYVPSYYTPDRRWPLVVTLHGTYLFDSPGGQIKEWKALAEKEGFIVAAPPLSSVQGVLPTLPALFHADLQRDEKTILDCVRDVRRRYAVHPRGILLTGFSAGGYPMYYVGLRHPEIFAGLVARGCNSSDWVFQNATLSPQTQEMPVVIIWGRGDFGPIAGQSESAFRWLREHQCIKAEEHTTAGGHMRIPEAAWEHWRGHLPTELRLPRQEYMSVE